MPDSYLDSGSTFAVLMYKFASEGLYLEYAFPTAAVLMILVILINILVTVCEKLLKKKL